jgi:hypothetical protein
MSQPLSPVAVEHGIREVAERIAKGVRIVSDRYAAFLAADRAYDQAHARAYLGHDGPAHERKPAAELATVREREARDVADVAFRYADRTARALENELRAYQSIGASLRQQYSVAGVGER